MMHFVMLHMKVKQLVHIDENFGNYNSYFGDKLETYGLSKYTSLDTEFSL